MQNRYVFGLLLVAFWTSLVANAAGQVEIVSNGQKVAKDRVQTLFDLSCRVIGEEFRIPDPSVIRFHVTLVLGDSNERIVGDEINQTYFIYMNRWDEMMFTTSATRLAMHHVLSRERKAKLVQEVLQRSGHNDVISVQELQARSRH
jgi:hypothetical protein